jgi:preprotein translocase subunit SecG
MRLFRKSNIITKILTFLFFIAVIVFIILFTKNKGSITAVINDIRGLMGK